jgi:hypothetical protein
MVVALLDLPHLKHLGIADDMRGQEFDEEGMQTIGRLKQLRLLSIAYGPVGNSWRHLASLSHVDTVQLGVRDMAAALKWVSKMPSVKSVTVVGRLLDGASANEFVRIPQLEELQILEDSQQLGDGVMEAVGRLKNLRRLRVQAGVDKGGRDFAHLDGLQRLESLEISWRTTTVLDHGIAAMRGMKHLETLKLSGRASKDAWRGLASSEKLRVVELRTDEMNESAREALTALANLKHLEELTIAVFEGVGVDDSVLAQVGRIDSLRRLTLVESQCTDKGLAQIARMRNLQRLHVGGTRVTDRSVVDLREMKQLIVLDVSGTSISDAGLAELRRALPKTEINGQKPGK